VIRRNLPWAPVILRLIDTIVTELQQP